MRMKEFANLTRTSSSWIFLVGMYTSSLLFNNWPCQTKREIMFSEIKIATSLEIYLSSGLFFFERWSHHNCDGLCRKIFITRARAEFSLITHTVPVIRHHLSKYIYILIPFPQRIFLFLIINNGLSFMWVAI